MSPKFIGREKEIAILQKTLESAESEMVTVIGRRRVGKTSGTRHPVLLEIEF